MAETPEDSAMYLAYAYSRYSSNAQSSGDSLVQGLECIPRIVPFIELCYKPYH
jgi:hypothetical protein